MPTVTASMVWVVVIHFMSETYQDVRESNVVFHLWQVNSAIASSCCFSWQFEGTLNAVQAVHTTHTNFIAEYFAANKSCVCVCGPAPSTGRFNLKCDLLLFRFRSCRPAVRCLCVSAFHSHDIVFVFPSKFSVRNVYRVFTLSFFDASILFLRISWHFLCCLDLDLVGKVSCLVWSRVFIFSSLLFFSFFFCLFGFHPSRCSVSYARQILLLAPMEWSVCLSFLSTIKL